MKRFLLLLLLSSTMAIYGNGQNRYLFFLHNRFLEEHELNDIHPEYGKTEYEAILNEFKTSGLKVFSEKRNGNVNAREYAL